MNLALFVKQVLIYSYCVMLFGGLFDKKVEYLNCDPIKIWGVVLERMFFIEWMLFLLGMINYLLYNHKSIVMKKMF